VKSADLLDAEADLGTDKIAVLYQMQPALTARHRRMYETSVEAGKAAAVRNGQRKQVAVGHLLVAQQPTDFDTRGVQQTDVVGPKNMPAPLPQPSRHASDNGRRSRRVGIPRMSNNAQHRILCDGTGCPTLAALVREPAVRQIMTDMSRVDQRNQNVDV
jgi:hypothetical protein